MTMITGLFKDRDSAERAFQVVIDLGYDKDDINVVMSNEVRQQYFAPPDSAAADAGDDMEEKAAAGTSKLASTKLGGPMGGTMGTLAPVVAAVGALLIPGFGIVVGPVAIALAAAGAVGVAGGIVGILTNWGIPNSRIKQYEDGIRAGGILLGVKTHADGMAQQIQQRWQELGGEYVHS